MKRILLPVDLSKGSELAVRYGLQLAAGEGAELIVLNVVSPLAEIERQSSMSGISSYLQERTGDMHEYVYPLQSLLSAGAVQVNYICKAGHPIEIILEVAHEEKCDLIIMGSRGANNFSKFVLGSTSQGVFGLSKIPLMIVPSDYSKDKLNDKVCFATDFHFHLNAQSMRLMTTYNFLAGSLLHFVHVHSPTDFIEEDKHRELVALVFGPVKSKIKYIQSDIFEDSLDTYMKATGSGLLIMLPHPHSLLYQLFFRGHTLGVLKKLNYPVLVLYE